MPGFKVWLDKIRDLLTLPQDMVGLTNAEITDILWVEKSRCELYFYNSHLLFFA